MEKHLNTTPRRMAYGMADIFGGGAFVVISTFYTVFLTKSLGMAPLLAGTIPLVGKVWDAVTDPIMGNIADRTQSKFGPKRFYLMIGSVISALTFLMMWISYEPANELRQYVFYMIMYMLFSTGFTIVMVPYNALLPDMVDDYTERSRFTGVRMIFSTLGAIIAGLVPTILIRNNTDSTAYFKTAVIFAVLFLICILVTFAGTWEKQKPVRRITFTESFLEGFSVYRSRVFRLFLLIFLFGQGAADFVTGLAVYYVDDVLNAYGGGNFTVLMGVILGSQFLGMFIWGPVLQRTSKTTPILIGFPIRMVASLLMLFFSHEGASFFAILVLTFFIGFGMAASSVSIYAILTDMADVDELITGISRPSICSGMATFVRKIATGFSSAIIGVLLAIVGYDEDLANAGLRQSLSTQHGIAAIYILVPVLFMVITMIFAKRFPLGRKEFDVVRHEIARRRGEENSTATEEEKKICERVTGFAYDKLWQQPNI